MAQEYGPKVVTDGLVLCLDAADKVSYPGSGTTWTDLSGNGNDGTLSAAAIGTDTPGVMEFNASDDLILTSFGNGLNPTTTLLSYALWVYPDTAGSMMFMAQGSWAVNARAYFGMVSGYWAMGIQASGWGVDQGGSAVIAGRWHHIVIVFDGSNVKWYQNGNYIFQKAYTSYAFDLVFGLGNVSTYSDAYPWDDKIATCAIYQIALTAAEVSQNFNAQRSRFGI
jgi:hypothetical protein